MLVFKIICLCYLILYILTIVVFTCGWIKLKPFNPSSKNTYYPIIDVLIACRNESHTIENLISDLENQNYLKSRHDIVFINDHSTDDTVEVIKQKISGLCNFKILDLPDYLEGKKAALQFGIKKSNAELILFTDADCRVSPDWLKDSAEFYMQKGKPDLIIGIIDQEKPVGLFKLLQYIDFVSLIGTTIGSASVTNPIMCNGANLAVKKDVFDNHTFNNSGLSSGDDVFLLHRLKKDKQRKINVLKPSIPHIITKSEPDLTSFIRQRIRWASKATSYTDWFTIYNAILILSVNVITIISYIFLILNPGNNFFILFLFVRLITDVVFFIPVLHFFKRKKLIPLLPVAELIYPFYIVYAAISGIIKKPFQWKGRILSQ